MDPILQQHINGLRTRYKKFHSPSDADFDIEFRDKIQELTKNFEKFESVYGSEVIKITGHTINKKTAISFFKKDETIISENGSEYKYILKIFDNVVTQMNSSRLYNQFNKYELFNHFIQTSDGIIEGGTYEEMIYGSKTVAEMI